ncbi:hypothetical protein [Pantoea sp. ME81]|uniref:hypothetical protein n=1 Tax=Pantoea sp. ME81 TaxID=2743935 RepID=UPI0015F38A9E|nr:hypothetical protein [Pantoea sp. ME81]
MTQVIHGLTREQLVAQVYGNNPPPVPKRRRKKYNATEAMVQWIEGMNKAFSGGASRSNNSGNSKKGE